MIEVNAPSDPNQRVQFWPRWKILPSRRQICPLPVILNARTGSIVMNQAVTVEPCAVAHGNLSVTVTNTPASASPTPCPTGGPPPPIRRISRSIKTVGAWSNVPKGTNLSQIVKGTECRGCHPAGLAGHPAGHESRGLAQGRFAGDLTLI